MIDFPAAPVLNDTFAGGGIIYKWNGYGWVVTGDAGLAPGAAPASPIPVGTVMLFFQAAAPAGWTKLVVQNDKALRINSVGGVAAGGAFTFSQVMGQTQVGTTTLTVNNLPGSVIFEYGAATGEGTSNAFIARYATSWGGSAVHVHAVTMNVQYCDVIMASKN